MLADATVDGRTLPRDHDASRVVQRHVAGRAGAGARARRPAATSLPTVLLGDLNSRADGTATPTHANLLAAGFQDAWPQAHPNDIGLTCCHGDDLREVGGPFYSRIDYVLLRNGFRGVAAGIVGEAPR